MSDRIELTVYRETDDEHEVEVTLTLTRWEITQLISDQNDDDAFDIIAEVLCNSDKLAERITDWCNEE